MAYQIHQVKKGDVIKAQTTIEQDTQIALNEKNIEEKISKPSTDEEKAAIQQILDVPSNSDMSAYATKADTVLETSLSRGRKEGSTVGNSSFAFGDNVEASGESSFAIGRSSIASGSNSKAEGYKAVASGSSSHAEGNGTIANGSNTHAEGKYNVEQTIISDWVADMHYNIGDKVFHIFTTFECIEENTDATWDASHWKEYGFTSEVALVVGNGIGSTAEERSNAYALDWEGNGHYMGDVYVGANADSTGGHKVAIADDVTVVLGTGVGSAKTKDFEEDGHAYANKSSGMGSFAEGLNTLASGTASHAEGQTTHATGLNSHAEGLGVYTIGICSHAEGYYTTTFGDFSHAEGSASTKVIRFTGEANATRYTASSYIPIGSSIVGYMGRVFVTQIENIDGVFYITLDKTLKEDGPLENLKRQVFIGNASGDRSHTEGENSIAIANNQHVEGKNNEASPDYAHIVGNGVSAVSRSNAYALTWAGDGKYAGDVYVHANPDSTGGVKLATVDDLPAAALENGTGVGSVQSKQFVFDHDDDGEETTFVQAATGDASFAVGAGTTASGMYSHAEGFVTTAYGNRSHAEGDNTLARGTNSHAEGEYTIARGDDQHVSGKYNIEDMDEKYAEIVGNGESTSARSNARTLDWNGNAWYAGVVSSNANPNDIVSDDDALTTTEVVRQIVGEKTIIEAGTDWRTSATCPGSIQTKSFTHEGNTYNQYAYAVGANAFGMNCVAEAAGSFAEGYGTEAAGIYAHAEGQGTAATGKQSHAEGIGTIADGDSSHAEGTHAHTLEAAEASHAEGLETTAASQAQHVQGKYNIVDSNGTYAHIVGNGTSSTPSNAHTLDWNGNAWYAGNITANGGSLTLHDSTGDVTITAAQLRQLLATLS